MSFGELILMLLGILALLVLLPVIAYMVMKFGASGYFRAKQRQQERDTNHVKVTNRQP